MTSIDDFEQPRSDPEEDLHKPIDLEPPMVPKSAAPALDRKSVKAEQRRELMRTPSFLIGMSIVVLWLLCSLFPDQIARYGELDPVRVDGTVIARQAPSADAWFGTDGTGRDVYSRVVYGADNVLINAPAAAFLAVAFGAILGLIMGYYRGWVDEILSRVIEAVLSLPVILLAIMVLVVFGASRIAIILTIAGLFTPVVTRTVRAAVQSESQLDYVAAAKLRGESGPFIMLREILPNITNVLVVEFTVRVGYAIFTVATLAFLGLGADDVTVADWGTDISQTYGLIVSGQWWPSIFPALAIALLVIGVNLIADSLDKVYKG
jgi:peptide/nickel transport system permease protein